LQDGRPKLTDDEDRRLFSESARTCLLCNTRLFGSGPVPGRRSIPIAERAHIVAHSAKGPRGDRAAPADYLKDPANIVLLCPTCHTKADKDPDAYPSATPLANKARRTAAVAVIGGAPTFDSRAETRQAVQTLLERNPTVFRTFGPDAADGSLGTTEEAENWSKHVLTDIVPANELIVAIVAMNPDLTTREDRSAADLLQLHTSDLAEKHRRGEITAPALRFPREAADIFAGRL
jgi:HNH endonuclease